MTSYCTEAVTRGLSARLGPGVLCKWGYVAQLALALLSNTDMWHD
jgi:hypothetical protein